MRSYRWSASAIRIYHQLLLARTLRKTSVTASITTSGLSSWMKTALALKIRPRPMSVMATFANWGHEFFVQ